MEVQPEQREQVLQQVADAIRRYREETDDSPNIQIVPTGFRSDGHWYYVVVEADDRPTRSAVYYDHLHAIERILEKEGLDVLLVPTLIAL